MESRRICIERHLRGFLLLPGKEKSRGTGKQRYHETISPHFHPLEQTLHPLSTLDLFMDWRNRLSTFHPFRLLASRFTPLLLLSFPALPNRNASPPTPYYVKIKRNACTIFHVHVCTVRLFTWWAPVIVPRLYKVYRAAFGQQKSIRSFLDHG